MLKQNKLKHHGQNFKSIRRVLNITSVKVK